MLLIVFLKGLIFFSIIERCGLTWRWELIRKHFRIWLLLLFLVCLINFPKYTIEFSHWVILHWLLEIAIVSWLFNYKYSLNSIEFKALNILSIFGVLERPIQHYERNLIHAHFEYLIDSMRVSRKVLHSQRSTCKGYAKKSVTMCSLLRGW